MVKKKPRNFFARKKEIVAEKKKLVLLNKERQMLEQDLNDMLDMYQLPQDILQRMPVSSFYDLFTTPHQEGQDDQVKLLEVRDKIRKDHKEKITRLEELMTEIKLVKIELTLAKIRCIDNELNLEKPR